MLMGVLFAKVVYPIDDEAVFANPAYNLVTHGNFGTNIVEHDNTLKGIESRTYWFQPLYPLLLSGWFQVVPVSPLNQRLLSVGWGLVALGAWFVVSVRLTRNVWCAATVALGLSLDYVFLSAAGTGRMDMMSTALSWLGVALYVEWRERSLPRAVFLACSACALNVVTHPLGAILGVLNLVIVFVLLDLARGRFRLLLPAAVPFLLVGGVWAAYIVQSPGDFVSQFLNNVNLTGPTGDLSRLSGFANPLHALSMLLSKIVQGLYGPVDVSARTISVKMFIPLAYLTIVGIAVAYQRVREQIEIRVLLLLGLTDFVMLALLNVRGKVNYFVHATPLLTVLAVLVAWRSPLLRWTPRVVVIACCAVLLVLNGARLVHSVWYDAYRNNYLPVQRALRAVIPPESTVFAQAEWAFALGFERILHDSTLGFRSGKRLDYLVVDKKQQFDVDVYSQRIPGFKQYSDELLTHGYALLYQDPLVRIYRRRTP
jgi:hypothetical protein